MENNNISTPPNADLSDTGQSETPEKDDSLASRWARLAAVILDGLIIGGPFLLIFYGTEYWDRAIRQEIAFHEQIISMLIGLATYLILNGYLLSKRGQTIGKWALGVKIVSNKSNQILPLWKVFALRYVPKTVITLIPIVGQYLLFADDLLIFRKDKRCVHDFIAGTKVVREDAH